MLPAVRESVSKKTLYENKIGLPLLLVVYLMHKVNMVKKNSRETLGYYEKWT